MAESYAMSELKVGWKQGPLIALFGVSLLFAIGGFLLLFRGMEGDVLGAGIVLALFVPASVIFGRRLFDRRPRLSIDDEGILDPYLKVGKIPWHELGGAYVQQLRRRTFLCLVPREPERWLARKSPLGRLMSRGDQALGFTALNVDLTGVDCDPQALQELIQQRIAAAAPEG